MGSLTADFTHEGTSIDRHADSSRKVDLKQGLGELGRTRHEFARQMTVTDCVPIDSRPPFGLAFG